MFVYLFHQIFFDMIIDTCVNLLIEILDVFSFEYSSFSYNNRRCLLYCE